VEEVEWNGRDSNGEYLPPGRYPYYITWIGTQDVRYPVLPWSLQGPDGEFTVLRQVNGVAVVELLAYGMDEMQGSDNKFEIFDSVSGTALSSTVWTGSYSDGPPSAVTTVTSMPMGYVRSKQGLNSKIILFPVLDASTDVKYCGTGVKVKIKLKGDVSGLEVYNSTKEIIIPNDYTYWGDASKQRDLWGDELLVSGGSLNDPEGKLHDHVKIGELRLEWVIACSAGSPWTGTQYTPGPTNGPFHPVYITYDLPIDYQVASDGTPQGAKYPWVYVDPQTHTVVPEKSPLAMACSWACGESIDTNVVSALTRNTFNNVPHTYNSDGLASTHPEEEPASTFWLNLFLDPDYEYSDCIDMAYFLHVINRSIGLNVQVQRIGRMWFWENNLWTKYIQPISQGQGWPWIADIYLNETGPGPISSQSSSHSWLQIGWNSHYTGKYDSTLYEPTFKMQLSQSPGNAQGVLNQKNAPENVANYWGFQYQSPGDYYLGSNPTGTFITGMNLETYLSHLLYEHDQVEYEGKFFGEFNKPSISTNQIFVPKISTE